MKVVGGRGRGEGGMVGKGMRGVMGICGVQKMVIFGMIVMEVVQVLMMGDGSRGWGWRMVDRQRCGWG